MQRTEPEIDTGESAAPVPDGVRLNVGSGPHCPEGWVNIDGSWQAWLGGGGLLARVAARLTRRKVGQWPKGIVCRDVRRPLPYADGSVAVVYSSHTLEHLHRSEAVGFLEEARRVLMPGGVCRIVVPDLHAIVGWYLDHMEQPPESKEMPSGDMLMEMLVMSSRQRPGKGLLGLYHRLTDFHRHKWMYDADGLLALLRDAGFEAPRICGFLDSDIPRELLGQVERADRVERGAGICGEARR